MRKKTFFNIGMLTVSNLIIRFLGMGYKVWLAKAISPVALGIYQLSMSLYMVLLSPVASGLPGAVSRLSSKYSRFNKQKSVLASALKIAVPIAIVTGLFMLCCAPLLSKWFLHSLHSGAVIISLIPAVTLGAVASLYAGYLHGLERSSLPAIFEIIEQFFKILCGVMLVLLFAKNNENDAFLPALAVSCGGILSFIMLYFASGKEKQAPLYTREVFLNAYPITLSRLAQSLLHLLTTTVLPIRLIFYGLSQEAALSQYGILTSMAYPVVYIPLTVTGALCVVLMPKIARSDISKIRKNFKKAFLFAFITCFLFCIMLLLFAPWVAADFLKQPLAGTFIVMLIPSVMFSGINQVCSSVLNGLGKQRVVMTNCIIDGIIGLFLTFVLVGKFGIYGFIAGNCIQDAAAFITNFICAMHFIRKEAQK